VAAATVIEELLDRVGKSRGLPKSAEHLLELGEAPHRDGTLHRPLECAADKGGNGARQPRDDRLGPASRELQPGGAAFNH